ncbi:HAD family hydrolase [Thermospira aquatica]|uniref:HAD family phosphatase n=1 Tax=Thermospira aquatica TaxID=2828656 RepID=A0AAX3BD25_9SPIR|nr:HAD family phosphatase [Thermospira aquatica]URA10192.1 HAD family phosphatase [Thermospira aquatica]
MKAVIFDMDGLMVDTESFYFEVERDMGRKRGKRVEDELLHRMMGQKPLDSMRLFVRELGLDESPETLLAERDERILACIRTGLQPMPGLYEIVRTLKPLVKLAIGTGNTKKMVTEVLKALGLEEMFDIVQTSDDVSSGKPSPEIFVKAVEKLNISPERAAVLEDSANGIRAAHAAGCLPLAVPNEYTKSQDFSLAHRVFGSLYEAKDFLMEWVRQ